MYIAKLMPILKMIINFRYTKTKR